MGSENWRNPWLGSRGIYILHCFEIYITICSSIFALTPPAVYLINYQLFKWKSTSRCLIRCHFSFLNCYQWHAIFWNLAIETCYFTSGFVARNRTSFTNCCIRNPDSKGCVWLTYSILMRKDFYLMVLMTSNVISTSNKTN